MRALHKIVSLTLFVACVAHAAPPVGSWTFVPADEDQRNSPWRIIVSEKGEIESQTLFAGVRSSRTYSGTVSETQIEFSDARGEVHQMRRQDDTWILRDEREKKDLVFVRSTEWDAKFDAAPPIPKSRSEAIATLRKIVSPESQAEIRSMKKEDLISLHFGMGMGIRNAFGLWSQDSPLLQDLGGGHPDDASMRLIEAFWEDLQKDKRPNQPLQRNAGSRPSSDGSPVSESPSSRGPRG